MKLSATPKTPSINFDTPNQVLEIRGISCPENPVQFYNPLLEELLLYFQKNEALRIMIHLDYFNTGSSKCLLNLFNLVAENVKDKNNTPVIWITEEEDAELKEAGKIFQEMSGLPFSFENLAN